MANTKKLFYILPPQHTHNRITDGFIYCFIYFSLAAAPPPPQPMIENSEFKSTEFGIHSISREVIKEF